MTDEIPEGRTKYDRLAMIFFDKPYWQLDNDQQIEISDLWKDENS